MNDQVEEQMVEISLDIVTWLSQCCAEPTNYHMVHNTYIIKKLHNWLHSGRTAVLYSVDQNLPSPCRSRLARETMCAYSWNRKANVFVVWSWSTNESANWLYTPKGTHTHPIKHTVYFNHAGNEQLYLYPLAVVWKLSSFGCSTSQMYNIVRWAWASTHAEDEIVACIWQSSESDWA